MSAQFLFSLDTQICETTVWECTKRYWVKNVDAKKKVKKFLKGHFT